MSEKPAKAVISAIEYALPEAVLSTAELARQFPEWSVPKIDAKTGIEERHIAGPDECASDLAVAAAQKLFASGVCTPDSVDYLLLCTQSPDYILPTTACLLQHRLGMRTSVGAIDFNLGCSGFIYGLGLAKGLIETRQAGNVLLITAETYSKFMEASDRSVRTIFGDGAAATLVSAVNSDEPLIGPFVYGTDGSGGEHLIVRSGGARMPRTAELPVCPTDESGETRRPDRLYMNGPEIFSFTLSVVPPLVTALLEEGGVTKESVDLFVFHQANAYMLSTLRRKIGIPEDKFCVSMRHSGNTVSATIPIALKTMADAGRLSPGALVMLVGFGVGLSYGGTLVRWGGGMSS